MYYYSPGENAFFPEELKQDYIMADSFPKDTIEVGDDVWLEFAGNLPPKGKQRITGTDGFPAWGDIPPPTKEALMSAAEKRKSSLMQIATAAIAPLQDAVDLDMVTEAEKSVLLAWKKYRVLLNRVDISTAPDIDWPEEPQR
ncbi:tail fiber assembly protein [Arsenophonus sp.]|uniref:tail fiber assembly protein n=1 Tax=Arsenophonus sp. TaxID=1872640 RepID=UPI003879CD96